MMGKVRCAIETLMGRGFGGLVINTISRAEFEDSAAHAAGLEAKDKRIAELEAELARRKELPPLPESVRVALEFLLSHPVGHWVSHVEVVCRWLGDVYSKPVSQWEKDAKHIETHSAYGSDGRDIAARLREMGRKLERAKGK